MKNYNVHTVINLSYGTEDGIIANNEEHAKKIALEYFYSCADINKSALEQLDADISINQRVFKISQVDLSYRIILTISIVIFDNCVVDASSEEEAKKTAYLELIKKAKLNLEALDDSGVHVGLQQRAFEHKQEKNNG